MATDHSLWTSDDCVKFVQQAMKTFDSKVSDNYMDRVISNLRSNHVTGSTLMEFSDEEWRELISSTGLRVHIHEASKKVIKAEEKVSLSQLHPLGLPKPPAEEAEKLAMHPRIDHLFFHSEESCLQFLSQHNDSILYTATKWLCYLFREAIRHQQRIWRNSGYPKSLQNRSHNC